MELPDFLNGVDFFETTLDADIYVSSVEILLPAEAMQLIPEYPFALTIGEPPNDIMVLCTADGETDSVPNGKIVIDPTFFNSEGFQVDYPKDTPVYAAVSAYHFKQIHDFLRELLKEYQGLYKTMALLQQFDDLGDVGVYDYDSSGNSFLATVNDSGDPAIAVDIAAGIGVVNGRMVASNETVTIDLIDESSTIPDGQAIGVLICIDELSQFVVVTGDPSAGTPDIPDAPANHLPLCSFTMNISAINEEDPTDERGVLLTFG